MEHLDRTQEVIDFIEANVERRPDGDPFFWPLIASKADWHAYEDPTRLHGPFGYSTPTTSLGEIVFVYCPDVIAEQTRELSNTDFIDYLTFLITHVNLHYEYFDLADEEAEARIDSEMYGLSPRTMGIVNQVQLRALDPA